MHNILILFIVLFTQTLMAEDGIKLYQKCISCHGSNGEKRALGKSRIIQKLDASEILDALQGYKMDMYGGPMKSVMQSQVKDFSEDNMKVLSEYIVTLKSPID